MDIKYCKCGDGDDDTKGLVICTHCFFFDNTHVGVLLRFNDDQSFRIVLCLMFNSGNCHSRWLSI